MGEARKNMLFWNFLRGRFGKVEVVSEMGETLESKEMH